MNKKILTVLVALVLAISAPSISANAASKEADTEEKILEIIEEGKEKLGIIPCTSSVFPRLIALQEQPRTFMLSEELILHYLPKVFKEYFVKAKSLIRVTRNADIDPDEEMYDDDTDFRQYPHSVLPDIFPSARPAA